MLKDRKIGEINGVEIRKTEGGFVEELLGYEERYHVGPEKEATHCDDLSDAVAEAERRANNH